MAKDINSGEPRNTILFNKYEMGRVLGKGTFAKVYHARDLRSGNSVAIKVLNKDQILRVPGMMNQIQREISVMRLVRHPNIVALHEVMATKSRIFFVMEYVTGGELFAVVARGRLPENQARRYFNQLLAAIDFCHSRGVSHRDLKPENLLLDANGDLKVSDFGLSALPEQRRHDGLLHTRCGTPAYVAPEVLRRRGYDGAKADLWSCGVVLYVLLAGFLPFQHDNLMRMYSKIFKGEYEVPPWFSDEARDLVVKLLVVEPERRISIGEIKAIDWLKIAPCPPISLSKTTVETADGIEKPCEPMFYNAFELISSLSPGFDLTGLFVESRPRSGTVFTSRFSPSTLLSRLESLGRAFGFRPKRQKSSNVEMESGREGRKGPLVVSASVYEVVAGLSLVEISKSSGDTLEFVRFCEDDVRPGLEDMVWVWHGEEGKGAASFKCE